MINFCHTSEAHFCQTNSSPSTPPPQSLSASLSCENGFVTYQRKMEDPQAIWQRNLSWYFISPLCGETGTKRLQNGKRLEAFNMPSTSSLICLENKEACGVPGILAQVKHVRSCWQAVILTISLVRRNLEIYSGTAMYVHMSTLQKLSQYTKTLSAYSTRQMSSDAFWNHQTVGPYDTVFKMPYFIHYKHISHPK